MRISDWSSDVCSSDLLATNVNHGGEAEGDRLFGLETVIGSNYADSITGSDDVLAGDTLYGRGGDDLLGGGAGDDHPDGGSGTDLLRGGPGGDLFELGRASCRERACRDVYISVVAVS